MRLSLSRHIAAPAAGEGVTTLELFFDLVFVYIITQVTAAARDAVHPEGYLRALAILVVTWWIYDGYCWLGNNIGPTTLGTRAPMLVAMLGFLVMARRETGEAKEMAGAEPADQGVAGRDADGGNVAGPDRIEPTPETT